MDVIKKYIYQMDVKQRQKYKMDEKLGIKDGTKLHNDGFFFEELYISSLGKIWH